MRISDWSSDVCSSDLRAARLRGVPGVEHRLFGHAVMPVDHPAAGLAREEPPHQAAPRPARPGEHRGAHRPGRDVTQIAHRIGVAGADEQRPVIGAAGSEEHTSELQSLMRISYAVFCLQKKTHINYST